MAGSWSTDTSHHHPCTRSPMLHCLLVFVLSLGAAAQAPEPMTYLLKNHDYLTGRVVAVDGDVAVIDVTIMGGSAKIRRRLADFAPASEFEIRATMAPPVTFEDHVALAKTAVRLDLLGQAGEHAGKARKLAENDATGAQRQGLDVWAAAVLHVRFDRAIEQGELADARHFLRLVTTRVPLQFSEDQVGGMFDVLAEAEAKARTATRTVTLGEAASARRGAFDEWVGPVMKRVQEADEKVKDGLRNARSTVKATNSFEQALRLYESASRDLRSIPKELADDAWVQDEVAEILQRVKNSAVQAIVHAGNALTIQGDYRSALEWASKGLAIDPANPDAKALIRTIQIAQAAGGPWGGWNR